MAQDEVWPDWFLDTDPIGAEESMRNLARYATPRQLRRLGLGLGHFLGDGTQRTGNIVKAQLLAEQLTERDIGYTIEPFYPRASTGQLVRTTAELLEGVGTCLDFAVSLAALCVQANIPVVLAIAIPPSGDVCHAFTIVQEEDEGAPVPLKTLYSDHQVQTWLTAFAAGPAGTAHQLIDATPLDPAASGDVDAEPPGTLSERTTRTIDWLKNDCAGGRILAVDVRGAVQDAVDEGAAEGFYLLPPPGRDLGITTWLPDLPPDIRTFPSRAQFWAEAPHEGSMIVLGAKGSGKSTLALQRAQQASGGRGWFLDGSDRKTLVRSFADAEAQCRGTRLTNDLPEHQVTLASAARRRLSQTGRPWVVIVDNADGPPGEVLPQLPIPGPGQSIIVTTTNEKWRTEAEGDWRVLDLAPLTGADLREEERTLGLVGEELLPGLLRIADRCDRTVLQATMTAPPGALRLVRAALASRPHAEDSWPASDPPAAVTAAAFMPAEEITIGWLAGAAFSGDRAEARASVRAAADRGLIEHSRRSLAARDHDELPLWMHRLVREAVRELTASQRGAQQAGLEVLALHRRQRRSQRYSATELAELADFIAVVPQHSRSHLFAQAAAAVLDLLEPQGSAGVERAAELAATAQTAVDSSRADAVNLLCTMLMARARPAVQKKKPTPEELAEAITFCRQAVDIASGDDREDLLLRGRAEAMRGILLRRQAGLLAGPEKLSLLENVIDVLRASYDMRRAALTDPVTNTLRLDPDHHVDRGWFNLGGAYIALANAVGDTDPARRPDCVSEALRAYAGSLSLRPADDLYTAASLWGVGLALYTAAVYCPGDLDLTGIEPVAELDPVLRQQTRESLLRAAEQVLSKALDLRADIDGPTGSDTKKARDLHRKVSLAWETYGTPEEQRERLRAAVQPFLDDLGLTGCSD